MSNVAYQASPLKRRRRTNKQLETLDRQIVEILQADHPQSIRHVFYRLTDPRLAEPIEKSDAGYNQAQARMTKLRRDGVIPYHWLADMSRRGYFVDTFNSAGEFITRVKSLYRSDLWRNAERRCEIWCESRSIASVILGECRELAVSLYPCGGFSSISFAHDAAQELQADYKFSSETGGIISGQPVTIFYIGDYDPAGVLIDVALERELRLHLHPDIDLKFVRLGITPEQIVEYDLPEKPRKEGDRRALHIEKTVEAEAMPAHVLRKMLKDSIESLLPENALRIAKVAEESERFKLTELAKMARGARQ